MRRRHFFKSESNKGPIIEDPSQLDTEICKEEQDLEDLKVQELDVQKEKRIIESRLEGIKNEYLRELQVLAETGSSQFTV